MAEENVTLDNLKQAMESSAAAEAGAQEAAEAAPEAEAAEKAEEAEEAAPPPPEEEAPVVTVEPVIDDHGRSYATGKRKDAVARVWIKPGSGKINVNGRDWETYFARPVLRMIINQPFEAAARAEQYDVTCTVKGGGLSGQAGAVRHGISKAGPRPGGPALGPSTPGWSTA